MPATIVAEVKDSKYDSPIEGRQPYFCLPFRQWFQPGLNFAFLVKTAGDPMLVLPGLRREALTLNQDAVFHSMRLTDTIGYSLYAQMTAALRATQLIGAGGGTGGYGPEEPGAVEETEDPGRDAPRVPRSPLTATLTSDQQGIGTSFWGRARRGPRRT